MDVCVCKIPLFHNSIWILQLFKILFSAKLHEISVFHRSKMVKYRQLHMVIWFNLIFIGNIEMNSLNILVYFLNNFFRISA